MGPSSDQIERQITQVRGSLESKVVELRERGERKVQRATRTAVIVAGAGAALGVAVIGAFVVYRLTRPTTPGERMRRLAPAGLWRLGKRVPRVPQVRVYVGDRPVDGEAKASSWERIAVRAARAAGTAAASALAPRLLAAVTESLRSRRE